MTCQQIRVTEEAVVEQIPAGAHICHIYTTDEDRDTLFPNILIRRLKLGECAVCLSDRANERELSAVFNRHNLSYSELLSNGAFMLSDNGEIFLKDNFFDFDRVLEIFDNYYQESNALGFKRAWVIGDMPAEVQKVTDRNGLLEYELRLGLFLDACPVITVCQYDANLFDEATILDILKIHPYIVVQGSIVRNPLYASLSEFI